MQRHAPWAVPNPVRSTTARQPPSGVLILAPLSPVDCSSLVPPNRTCMRSRLMFSLQGGVGVGVQLGSGLRGLGGGPEEGGMEEEVPRGLGMWQYGVGCHPPASPAKPPPPPCCSCWPTPTEAQRATLTWRRDLAQRHRSHPQWPPPRGSSTEGCSRLQAGRQAGGGGGARGERQGRAQGMIVK